MFKKLKIDGLNKEYLIYDDGRLYDIKMDRFKKPIENKNGYIKYSFYINGKDKKFFIHRLVLSTFNPIEDMDNLQVNHIDGNKKNNCLYNLEWCTQSQNQIHAFSHGLISRIGTKNSQSKITDKDVYEIIVMLKNNVPYSKIAYQFGISKSTVSAIKSKRLWKHITKDIEF